MDITPFLRRVSEEFELPEPIGAYVGRPLEAFCEDSLDLVRLAMVVDVFVPVYVADPLEEFDAASTTLGDLDRFVTDHVSAWRDDN